MLVYILEKVFQAFFYFLYCLFVATGPIGSSILKLIIVHNSDLKFGSDLNENDLYVADFRFFADLCVYGSKGLGHSYLKGWWKTNNVVLVAEKFLKSHLYLWSTPSCLTNGFIKQLKRIQSDKPLEKKLIQDSYDNLTDQIHDELEIKSVSCYYYKDTDDHIEAARNKLDLIVRKIKIKPGMRILDIGCGYGTQLKYIAQNYKGVECVGINISEDQVTKARIECQGLPIEIQLCHFMDIKGKFDRILCVEMMFHLGKWNIKRLLKKVNECLTDDGIFFVHAMQRSDPWFFSVDPWIDETLYKGHYLPYINDFLGWARVYFTLEEVHGLGLHMARTMFEWSKECDKLESMEVDEVKIKEIREMALGFQFITGAFYCRQLDLYHYIFTKKSSNLLYYGER